MDERKKPSIPIPEGFDLSKYDQCRNLTPGQWYAELEERAVIGLLPGLGIDEKAEFSREYRANRADSVRAILQKPVDPQRRERGVIFNPNPVRRAAVSDIAHLSRLMNSRYGSEEWDRRPDSDPIDDYVTIPDGFCSTVIIDLSVSDKVLMAQFGQYLNEMRIRHPFTDKKQVTNDKVKKLASYNVLAILDLLIYERMAGRQLVRKDMAELLGVDYQTLVETRMPFALSAVSDEFLSDLAVVSNAGA